MKILIAADMEGISGVVHWEQVTPGTDDYARFRRIMTQDVNAAVRGAFEAGAREVIVADGHNNGRNLLIEELDPRAMLNSGTPSPLSMVQGIDAEVNGVCFIGYHARIGTPNAILEHTWSDERVTNLWINDQLFGETGLNAAVCAHFNAPVIMVSGDQAVCDEARQLLGDIETAVVKWASGRMAAECFAPQIAQQIIQDCAARAVSRLSTGQVPAPLNITSPIRLVVDFVQSEMADKAMLLPGSQRDGRRVEYSAVDILDIYSAFRTMLALARG
jgi:D-amino peptidase